MLPKIRNFLKGIFFIGSIPVLVFLSVVLVAILLILWSFLNTFATIAKEVVFGAFLYPLLEFLGIKHGASFEIHHTSTTDITEPVSGIQLILFSVALLLGGIAAWRFWKKRKKKEETSYEKEKRLALIALSLFIFTFLPDEGIVALVAAFTFVILFALFLRQFNKTSNKNNNGKNSHNTIDNR